MAAVVLSSTQAGVGQGAAAVVRSGSRYVVVVSTVADRVNGQVSSVAALNAKPGRDGISLREALEAANNTGGARTVYVMFSRRLNGRTIEVLSDLPPIHRDHLVLEGVTPNELPVRVTLDGRRAPRWTLHELLAIEGSGVTVRWLRFTGVRPKPNVGTQEPAVYVLAGGEVGLSPTAPPPKQLANVQIVDDVFDNRGINYSRTSIDGPSGVIVFGGPNAQMSGITIARDTFLHETGDGDGVGVWSDSRDASIKGVVIEDNRFDQVWSSIELSERFNAPRLAGIRMVGNTITNGGGISVNTTNATNGRIDGTQIEGNIFSSDAQGAISLDAEAFVPRMGGKAGGDVISNTSIVNNVIDADHSGDEGIYILGGSNTTSRPSRVSGVTIENNTLVNDKPDGPLLDLIPSAPGTSGNQVTDINVRNSIFYVPSGAPIMQGGPGRERRPDVLTNSLISGPGWAGTNGNISGDPKFVNESGGDFHPAAGSPLINSGTTIAAPGDDLDGARRDASPDIGAFEFGATPRPLLTMTVYPLGGNGTVTSSPAGITCGTVCAARFDSTTTVTLAARPDRWARFLGWQGACSGKSHCTLTLDSDEAATARFGPKPRK